MDLAQLYPQSVKEELDKFADNTLAHFQLSRTPPVAIPTTVTVLPVVREVSNSLHPGAIVER